MGKISSAKKYLNNNISDYKYIKSSLQTLGKIYVFFTLLKEISQTSSAWYAWECDGATGSLHFADFLCERHLLCLCGWVAGCGFIVKSIISVTFKISEANYLTLLNILELIEPLLVSFPSTFSPTSTNSKQVLERELASYWLLRCFWKFYRPAP